MRESKAIKFNGKSYPVSYNPLVVCEMSEAGIHFDLLSQEETVLKALYQIAYYGVKGGHIAKTGKDDFEMSFTEFCLDLATDAKACKQCAELYATEAAKTIEALNDEGEEEEKKPKRRPKAAQTQAKK